MTDSKKKAQGKGGAKGKKLQLNKETLKDLQTKQGDEGPRGGAPKFRREDCTAAIPPCS